MTVISLAECIFFMFRSPGRENMPVMMPGQAGILGIRLPAHHSTNVSIVSATLNTASPLLITGDTLTDIIIPVIGE